MKNTNPNEKTNLQKLLEKQEKLKKQIKLEQKIAEEKKKQVFTQRCILVGALILEHIQNNGEFSEKILNILDASIESDNDKKLLGLELPSESTGNGSDTTMAGDA